MKIDLTEEEIEFLLRVCTRAKLFSKMGLLKNICYSPVILEEDMIGIETLINKLNVKNGLN